MNYWIKTKHLGKFGKLDFWRGKRVLVTGHTGFKGTWFCILLQKLGCHVTGISDDRFKGVNIIMQIMDIHISRNLIIILYYKILKWFFVKRF